MSVIDFHGVRLGIAAQSFTEHTFEPEETTLADCLFTSGDRVVVAGAGMGWLAAWIARRVGAVNVLAIEALPHLASLIAANVAVDGTPLQVRWGAVTPDGRSVTFPEDTDGWWLSRPGEGGIEVPGINLLDLQAEGWDCIATDIEGAEVDVLTPEVIASYRKVLVELHDFRRPDTNLVLDRLRASGMEIVRGFDRRPREQMRYQAWHRP